MKKCFCEFHSNIGEPFVHGYHKKGLRAQLTLRQADCMAFKPDTPSPCADIEDLSDLEADLSILTIPWASGADPSCVPCLIQFIDLLSTCRGWVLSMVACNTGDRFSAVLWI